MRFILVLLTLLFIAGCTTENTRPFQVKNLAKSDVDMVTDLHRRAIMERARLLTIKIH